MCSVVVAAAADYGDDADADAASFLVVVLLGISERHY